MLKNRMEVRFKAGQLMSNTPFENTVITEHDNVSFPHSKHKSPYVRPPDSFFESSSESEPLSESQNSEGHQILFPRN
jgi:hypothetical protein